MKRQSSLLAACCVWWGFSVSTPLAVAAEQRSQLWSVLAARAGSTQTFQADVQLTLSVGVDRERLARATRIFVKWIRKHRPDLNPASSEKMAKSLSEYHPPPQTTCYRYYVQAAGKLRIEEYGPPGENAYRREPITTVYTGDRWQSFAPRSRLGKSMRQSSMVIKERGDNLNPPFEVARGQAVCTTIRIKRIRNLSKRAATIYQVGWGELLQILSPETAKDLKEPLPSGGPPRPMLQVGTAPWKDTGLGLVRLRVWFDPEHEYLPLRAEVQELQIDRRGGKHYYLPWTVIEWSNPARMPGGVTVPLRCVVRHYHQYLIAADGVPENDWLARAYELNVNEFAFSNVRLNEPLDDSLFSITPPESTNVRDEVSGYNYIVGSAREELQKTAIALENGVLPRPEGGWPVWAKVLVAGILVLLTVGGTSVFLRLRKKRAIVPSGAK